jgi:hypothetical protein
MSLYLCFLVRSSDHSLYSEICVEVHPWRWSETVSLNCSHQRAYFSPARWHMEHGERRWNVIDMAKVKSSKMKLSQCNFVHHKSYMDSHGRELRSQQWERQATSRLSHGMAKIVCVSGVSVSLTMFDLPYRLSVELNRWTCVRLPVVSGLGKKVGYT